ncbi:MAG: PEP-utilizing enzyme [Microthrixaceae bacterium]
MLEGIGASRGLAAGRVRVSQDPSDVLDDEPGAVLVVRTTSPEWVPAMSVAAAVVTEVGGITSHAAIVARELGIPCVVGVSGATEVLRDGDLVQVDGTGGSVSVLVDADRDDDGA